MGNGNTLSDGNTVWRSIIEDAKDRRDVSAAILIADNLCMVTCQDRTTRRIAIRNILGIGPVAVAPPRDGAKELRRLFLFEID